METDQAQPVVTGQITEHEYIAAHALHRRNTLRLASLAALVACAAGVVLLVAGAYRWGMVCMGASIGGAIGEFIQTRFVLRRKLRRLYAQVRGRVDVRYAWDADRLFLTSERGNATRSWGDFTKAKENDEVVLLYLNDALFEIIAKRWFADAAALDAFRAHLKFVR